VRLLLAHQASGNDDDFDVLANGEVVGRIFKAAGGANDLQTAR
jgi:hypothetical protein